MKTGRISCIVCAFVSLTSLDVSAYSGGSGTLSDPYLMAVKADLLELAGETNDYSASFLMTADIDLAGESFNQAVIAANTDLGTTFDGVPFSGTFDGGGFCISNLAITAVTGTDYVGLFGRLEGAVRNLELASVSVTNADYYAGALAGYNTGLIRECSVSGAVYGSSYTGGLSGYNHYGDINGCCVDATVLGAGSYVGGLSGYNNRGAISHCRVRGTVFGSGSQVGGLCSYNYNGHIYSSYATASVSGGSNTGGLCGSGSGGVAIACLWDTNTTGQATSYGGTGKSTAEMQTESTFIDAGWVFADTQTGKRGWHVPVAGYPLLGWEIPGTVRVPDITGMTQSEAATALASAGLTTGQVVSAASWQVSSGEVAGLSVSIDGYVDPAQPVHLIVSSGGTGDGSADRPWEIASQADLEAVNTAPSSNFVMTADVYIGSQDLTETALIAADTNNAAVDFQGVPFSGVFDGAGHAVWNLQINALNYDRDYLGLFGIVSGSDARVQRLGMEAAAIIGGGDSERIGTVCGENLYGMLSECRASGNLTGDTDIGGLCGCNSYGEINECRVDTTVSDGIGYLGGLCGRNNYGAINNCCAGGTVSGSGSQIGGLCGYNYNGDIHSSYATASARGGSSVGGLCGGGSGGVATACFWDTNTTGQASSSGGTGISTAEMQTESTFIDAGWVFADTQTGKRGWHLPTADYPLLGWEIPDTVRVPDISGMTTAEAATALERAGLITGQVVSAASWQVSAGEVAGLSVSIHGYVDPVQPIDLIVSTGGSGDGSADGPWQIASQADLEAVNTAPSSSYMMTADVYIDCYNEIPQTALIVADTNNASTAYEGIPFSGIFDGAGHAVWNLRINAVNNDNDYLGLFGQISGADARVQRLGVEAAAIVGGSGSERVGAVCGQNSYGTLSECRATGHLSGDTYVGGLCGYNNYGEIYESHAALTISGDYYTGGLCGRNNFGAINNCYAGGTVSGYHTVGGLCGYNYNADIFNSYATAPVSGTYNTGGLCGYANGGTVTGGFWDTNTTGQATSTGGTGKSTAEMQTESTFTDAGWVFADTQTGRRGWYMPVADYPQLGWQMPEAAGTRVPDTAGMTLSEAVAALEAVGLTTGQVVSAASWQTLSNAVAGLSVSIDGYVDPAEPIDLIVSTGGTGDGSAANPWQIASQADLEAVNTAPASNFVMTADIYIGYENEVPQTALIAADTNNANTIYDGTPFSGIFDGAGHAVWNLQINAVNNDNDYLGLFGQISGSDARVQRLGMEAVGIIGGGDSDWVGSVCGQNSYGMLSECRATGHLSGDGYVGGLCGENFYGEINECHAAITVSGGSSSVGGLCGRNYYGAISDCCAGGSVSGTTYVGGLCGNNYNADILNSYATASVTGTSYPGGLCGYANGGTVIGGFWDTNTTGQITSYGGTGKTTAEMQIESTFCDAGWVFANTLTGKRGWYMPVADYPLLGWEIPGTVRVPDTAGMTLPEAVAALEAAGLTTGRVVTAASWQTPSNEVAGLSVSIDGYIDPVEPIDLIVSSGSAGDGSAANPWQIASQADLEAVNTAPASNFLMTADVYIDCLNEIPQTALIAADTNNVGTAYEGIPFSGIFDGAGHAVWNLRINAFNNDNDYLGLFGQISGADALVQRLGMEEVSIAGGDDSDEVGAVCGENSYGMLSECRATGHLSGDGYVGGLCGENTYGEINECYAQTMVFGLGAGNSCGGLCGRNYYGAISDCYAGGSVSGTTYVGGLCGNNYNADILNSYATASVNGNSYLGGLCGYETGADVTACFWDTNTSGQATSGGGTGLGTAAMQTESTFTAAGWDFRDETVNGTDDIWKMYDYPIFTWQVELTVVTNGTGGGLYTEDRVVEVTADDPLPGWEFIGWTAEPAQYTNNFQNVMALATLFTMPDEDVAITPNYFQWDADLDSLRDTWEQQIIDADPGDAITAIEDVLPEDDFDGDGVTNGDEYTLDRNPVLIEVMIYGLTAAQRPGTKLVDLTYTLIGEVSNELAVAMSISNATEELMFASVTGELGAAVQTGAIRSVVWNAGDDWDGNLDALTFTLSSDTFVPLHLTNASASVDTRDYSLSVASAYGAPDPAVGIHSNFSWHSTVTCTVDEVVETLLTNYVCTGWSGTGSVPATGATNTTGGVVLDDISSSITWGWLAVPNPLELTVAGGSGDGSYLPGTVVPIVADAPAAGWKFSVWTIDPAQFTNSIAAPMSASTTITMPSLPATVTANYFQWDADLDDLRDTWEQQIIDANPGDAIETIWDVLPGDDFDGDGVTNGEEYALGRDPVLVEVIISALTASQRPGTKRVDITYELTSDLSDTFDIGLVVNTGGTPFDATSVSGDIGSGVVTGSLRSVVWDAGTDWDGNVEELMLFVECDSVAPVFSSMVLADVDTRDYTLEVVSAVGEPVPAVGTHSNYCWSSVVTCAVEDVSTYLTNYLCTGWSGTGSVPATGSTNDTGAITLTNAVSAITWNWNAVPVEFDLTVEEGTGDGSYLPGAVVPIVAVPPSNEVAFLSWTADPARYTADIADAGEASTTFTMPDTNVTVTATYYVLDTDKDGMTDEWEQQIIDADPGDDIEDIFDVLPGDDYDGDGVTNLDEFSHGRNPLLQEVVISNVAAAQLAGTKIVEVSYELSSEVTNELAVALVVSNAAGVVTSTSLTGEAGANVQTAAVCTIRWDAGADWDDQDDVLTFVLTSDTFSPVFEAGTTASVDTHDYTLTIVSMHGTPVPAVGVTSNYCLGSVVTCAVNEVETIGDTRCTCTGWSGTELLPATGAGTNAVITIDGDATLAWLWATDYRLEVSVPGGNGSTSVTSAWYSAGSDALIEATPSGGYVLNSWTVDGVTVSNQWDSGLSNGVYWLEVAMAAPHEVMAEFIPDFSVALDNDLIWSTDGDAPWTIDNTVTHDGVDAMRSGVIDHTEESRLSTTVNGSGTLSFWWKVSSEDDYDYLWLYVDGEIEKAICGEVDWVYVSLDIEGEGDHQLVWEYDKDKTISDGSDCGWLDQVTWTEDGALAGFAAWADEHGLTGDLGTIFGEDEDGNGIVNGFEYAFGDNLESGDPLLVVQIIDGVPVADIPLQDPATEPYVEIDVAGSLNLADWELPVVPSSAAGCPANREWVEAEASPGTAFFRLTGQLR